MKRPAALLLLLATSMPAGAPVAGQEAAPIAAPATIRVTPGTLQLAVGETLQLAAQVRDEDGALLPEATVIFLSLDRRSVSVTPAGLATAHRPGDFELLARVPSAPEVDIRRDEGAPTARIAVHVPLPPLDSVRIDGLPERFWSGTRIRPEIVALDTTATRRDDPRPELSSSDAAVIDVDAGGYLNLRAPGRATLTAAVEGLAYSVEIEVQANPTVALRLQPELAEVRTGDVVRFTATALDASGAEVPSVPVQLAFQAHTVQCGVGEPPSGRITEDGRFVADLPGEYRVVAVAAGLTADATVIAAPRDVRGELEFVGQGRVADRKTSDLWVWQAPDGRDYAITGTWGAAGHAFIWDVQDPRNIQLIDMVKVDARTVNDVKVSADGRIAVISREGASDRKNGLVILDVSAPADGVSVLARYDDQLSGGVHNVFIYEDHVYALSNGQRYDVINIEDPRNPYRVGRFELDTPGHSIHDVWVERGIAVSSNWDDGVVLVDVGGGGMGGAPNNPVKMGQYTYPSGWNHAAFPYWSESAGRFYVFAGDEAFPRERNPMGTDRFSGPPVQAAGWIHVIDFTDMANPREVARYEVPYGGTHNFWVQDDVLYVAYYQAGLRLVDVSGELLGDLYRQGREIAYFLPDDPQGFKPNARRTWGTMPHDGNIFLSDNNSGLWAVRLKERR